MCTFVRSVLAVLKARFDEEDRDMLLLQFVGCAPEMTKQDIYTYGALKSLVVCNPFRQVQQFGAFCLVCDTVMDWSDVLKSSS